MDFSVPVDHRMKIKESKKRDKYKDLAGELKKMKIKNVQKEDDCYTIYGQETLNGPKKLVKTTGRIRNQRTIDTIQITVLLRSARIRRKVLNS